MSVLRIVLLEDNQNDAALIQDLLEADHFACEDDVNRVAHGSIRTIQKHVDNVWVLGGEFIRDLNYDPSLRKKPVDVVLRRMIEPDGGPLLYHGGEDEQRSFDSTCRKLCRFLTETAR